MTAPGVLLDIDGTLLDTNHLHTLAWWRGLRSVGVDAPMQQILELIGMGGDKLVPEIAGRAVPGASEAWSREFRALHDEVTVLPGARRLARELHESGVRVVLASSAPADEVDHFRSVLDIDRWLTAVTTSDDVDQSKPDAEIFETAMDKAGLDPRSTIAIGDTIWDAKAARRAGIGFVAVASGGAHPDELRREGAARVYRDAGELADDLPTGPLAPLLVAGGSSSPS